MSNHTAGCAAPLIPGRAVVLLLAAALLLAQATSAGELTATPETDRPAPVFTLKALDGKHHRLDDYRGKVVLLNFWASWCPPCLAELPSIQRLADRMANEAFDILLINVGESPFKVAKFLRLSSVRLTSLLDPGGNTFRAWGGNIYPTSFILDSDGRVRYSALGPIEWDGDEVDALIHDLLPRPKLTTN
jgi:thiol-disulfide isomerase/thioredoxin